MDRPIILISVGRQNQGAGWNEVQSVSTGCDVDYVNSILRAGGLPLLLPLLTDAAAIRDAASVAHGVMLTGGGDVVSLNYGEEPHRSSLWADPTRDEMELTLARAASEMQLPVLGICRGMQLLNVAAGGTLIQDIPEQVPGAHQHSTQALEPILAHTVEVEPDSRLARVLGGTRIQVNSYHHQAVKEPGVGLRVTARSRDGVAEGMEADDGRALLAVQWHPEELSLTDPASAALFQWIVDEAGRYRERTSGGGQANRHDSPRVELPPAPLGLEPPADAPASPNAIQFDNPPPIPRLVQVILAEAVRQSAAEIHLEPVSKGIVVSYAVNGTLREAMTIPKYAQSELFAHLRRQAGLDPANRTSTQEGAIVETHLGIDYRFYLQYHPSPVGESIFISIDRA